MRQWCARAGPLRYDARSQPGGPGFDARSSRCHHRVMPDDLAHLLAVARGERAPDLVIEGARVFSAFTREWLDVDVGVANGRIAGFAPGAGGRRIDGRGRHLVPGFVDAHVHVESSKLSVEEFSRLLLARGTTTVVADPHEFANVLGAPGIEWFLDASAQVRARRVRDGAVVRAGEPARVARTARSGPTRCAGCSQSPACWGSPR